MSNPSGDKDGRFYLCIADGEGSHDIRLCAGLEAVGKFYEESCGPDSDGTVDSLRRAWANPDEWRNEGTHLLLKLYCATFEAFAVDPKALARSSYTPFTPTHEHTEGGHYQLQGHGKMKGGVESEWEPCVFYANAEGMRFATDLLRWNARFVPLPDAPRPEYAPAQPTPSTQEWREEGNPAQDYLRRSGEAPVSASGVVDMEQLGHREGYETARAALSSIPAPQELSGNGLRWFSERVSNLVSRAMFHASNGENTDVRCSDATREITDAVRQVWPRSATEAHRS